MSCNRSRLLANHLLLSGIKNLRNRVVCCNPYRITIKRKTTAGHQINNGSR